MVSKYAPLESHLRDSGRARVPMTFREIERVIGAPLPKSAFRHRALWSNNPANWVMTRAWLTAGYATEQVDMQNRKLVFQKTAQVPDAGGIAAAAERSGSFARVFGALKDTVTIAPGTNLTDPTGEEWNAAR